MGYGGDSGGNRWLYPAREPRSGDTLVLFFSYSGGSSASFRAWARELPSDHVHVGVELPGRGRRAGEQFITGYQEAVDGVVSELRPFFGRPIVLFGHSLGARLAYRIGLALESEGWIPRLVVVSGGRPPVAGVGRPAIAHLRRDEFMDEAVRLGFASPEVAGNPEVRDLFAPVLQADLALAELPVAPSDERLAASTAVFAGTNDWLTPHEVVKAWSTALESAPSIHYFDGGHMFVHERTEEVVSTLNRLLAQAVPER